MSKSSKSPSSKSRIVKRASSTRAKPSQDTFLGMPGSWSWPGAAAIRKNGWDTSPDASAFPPKVWGFGWSFNFAYPTIKSKPLWARIGMFIIGLAIVFLILWAVIAVSLAVYYLITSGAK